jgi:hypothetical protein
VLQLLLNEIGIEIRIAHYPNLIHLNITNRSISLFPHLSRACKG